MLLSKVWTFLWGLFPYTLCVTVWMLSEFFLCYNSGYFWEECKRYPIVINLLFVLSFCMHALNLSVHMYIST